MYRQLAKAGNDDLRQDAVMQQLFGVVNRLLADDPATRARRLRVGTYRVVPFTPAAGVLEWVDNTTLLSEYLLGSGVLKGAHERYRPGDWKSRECREKLTNCKTRPEQRATYTKVEAHFKPVMHHFFLENFPTPHMWYQRRLAYTRSVAVNSVVGYIIGLGDRHSSNILMDQSSAEMIHIDLGVAFEQGKCLKTPEQVPFRMTRDIVDGMGATGVEGVMRRCCEESLRVLRANKDALTTIVAVLIHDPILKWAVSPERANQRQRDDGDGGGNKGASGDVAAHNGGAQPGAGAAPQEGNLDAERALMRVGQKLDGYEGSELRSVEGQVQQLLQDAQDPEKLCVMYPGWAAWV
jgi:ataxia telangiectasia mutated family protein